MTKIKLCGLMSLVDIDYANEFEPEYVGFVFAQSRRRISSVLATRMRSALKGEIVSIGVFVNENQETIASLVQSGVISMVQLHGDEDEPYIRSLKKRVAVPIIKAVSIIDQDSFVPYLASSADYLLLDAGKGGTGTTFDWGIAQRCPRPFFLAGGLHAGNLQEAIATAHPFAVDLSSGLEKEGKKDRSLMQEAVRLAHLT
jgi:phosphoribosylanthranilate isomerase